MDNDYDIVTQNPNNLETMIYYENNQNLHYQNQSIHTININLMQEGYPYFTSSEVLSTPTATDLNNDGVKELLFSEAIFIFMFISYYNHQNSSCI